MPKRYTISRACPLERTAGFNDRRLHTELDDIPPVEHETNHYRQDPAVTVAETREPSLH